MISKFRNYFIFGLVLIFLYMPLLYMAMYSFNNDNTMSGSISNFGVDAYTRLFQDVNLLKVMTNTLIVALLSALVSTIIGTFAAIGIYYVRQPRREETYKFINNILIVSPDVIIGASFLVLFTVLGVQLGFYSVLISHIAFSIPIVVIMVLPRLKSINQNYFDAARDLGSTQGQILTRVILPMLTPGILSGFLLALTYSLDDFAVTFFVTGNGFSTLSVEVYALARRGIDMKINALSTLIFVITIVIAIMYYVIQVRTTKMKKEAK